MPGGLIQLLTIGLQDAPLILNPEITFFKMTYRKHTNFSIEQIVKNIGPKKFNTFQQYKINTISDLLGSIYFIVDIPNFNVVKKITNNTQIIKTLQINELSIIYANNKTYLFYESVNGKYYLIPNTFFNLSMNDSFYNQIDGSDVQANLLANLNLLTTLNYGEKVNILTLSNSTLNQLLSVFRLNTNSWVEYWMRILEKDTFSPETLSQTTIVDTLFVDNFNYFTDIISQNSLVIDLEKKMKLILYNGYINYRIFNVNNKYLNFNDEVYNYYNDTTIIIPKPIFDADFAQNYTIINLNDSSLIETYRLNALKFNSLLYLFMLQNLYPTFQSKIKTFTFWKKYALGLNNKINDANVISNNNYFLEWTKRFNFYRESSYGNYESIQLQIYETFQKRYNECEQNILFLFNSMQIPIGREKIWCILKAFFNQFTDNNSNVICFEDHFNPNSSNLYLSNAIQNLYQNIYPTLLTSSNLNSNWLNYSDPTYIQPVDLALLYPYLAYKYIDSVINVSEFTDHHFMLLWRNKINIALFFRIGYNLDNYASEKVSTNSLQNTFLNLNDYGETNKNLTFYHNVNLNRDIKLDNLRNKLNDLFKSQSFYGTISIKNNDLSNNLVIISPSFNGLNDISYNMVNQNVEIVDEAYYNYTYDNVNNIIQISEWNNSIYNEIHIEINKSFIKMTNFNFLNNSLFIYPNIKNVVLSQPQIKLRMIKNILVPIIDFNAVSDLSGNIRYSNISLNKSAFPDTSFNMINYPDISFNTYNLFKTDSSNMIILNEIYNNTITIDITYDYNNLYELKTLYSDGTIERTEIIIDLSNNIITPVKLDLNNMRQIDLLEYNFNFQLITPNIEIIGNKMNNINITENIITYNIQTNLLSTINDIAIGNVVVAVGIGAIPIIYYSNYIWYASSNASTIFSTVNSISWNGTLWVAVGNTVGAVTKIATSTDGNIWTVSTNNLITKTLKSVGWSGKYWVATGDTISNGIISTSLNGLTWTNSSNVASLNYTTINTFCNSNNIWVIGGQNITGTVNTGIISFSVDGSGTIFTNSSNAFTYFSNVNKIIYNGNLFVAVGTAMIDNSGNITGSSIAVSINGNVWHEAKNCNNFFTTCNSIAWNGSMFVAGGIGNNTIAYSIDGETWFASTRPNIYPNIFTTINAFAWNKNYWIGGGNVLGASINGNNWLPTYNVDLSNNVLNTIKTYNIGNTNLLSSFNALSCNSNIIIAGGIGTNPIIYFIPSSGWNTSTSATSILSQVNAITYNGVYWIATGIPKTNKPPIALSVDGITWIVPTNTNNLPVEGLSISWTNSKWVLIGQGNTNIMTTSTDGNIWIKNTVSLTSANTFANSKTISVIGGSNIAYSNNTIFTNSTNASTIFSSVNKIIYNGNIFVAVGVPVTNTGNVIATSLNGNIWTPSNNGKTIFTSCNNISWNGSIFVAVGVANLGLSNIAYSTDGLNWTVSTSNYFTNMKTIIWSNENNFWLAGGDKLGVSLDSNLWVNYYKTYTPIITVTPNSFYWLTAYKDTSGNILPNKVFVPVQNINNILTIMDNTSDFNYELFQVPTTYAPNLFPILHHYLNKDTSGNIKNFQMNSNFYQEPYIFNTFHTFLAKDTSGNLLDNSGNIIDMENHRLNPITLDKIFVDLNGFPYSLGTLTLDSSGNYVDRDNNYTVVIDPSGQSILDPSGNYFVLLDINSNIVTLADGITPYFLIYLLGSGLKYLSTPSPEPLYYFYNFPINENTKICRINGNAINKILPINSGEFYIYNKNTYPAIFDILKVKSKSKSTIIKEFNQLFDQAFLQDSIFSPILSIIEKANGLYENVNLEGIKLLKTLGKTISGVIDNSTIINNLNLENYNNYDFNRYSLFAPYYYNLNNSLISNGIGLQALSIKSKGYIITQSKQIYESSSKISSNLQNYLISVSNVLQEQITYINTNQDLYNTFNQNEYQNTYLPKYKLENTVNQNLYTINNYNVQTLFDLNGNYSDKDTEIYLNDLLIDISSNNIANSSNMF